MMSMCCRIVPLAAVLLALATAAGAEGLPAALVCTFSTGQAASHVDGAFKRSDASPLAFEVRAIDLEGQSAQIVVKPGAPAGKLSVVRALNANHFIEVLNEGFLGLTTIFDKEATSGLYPAVHSRHVGVLGQAVVAQYTGTCKANEPR